MARNLKVMTQPAVRPASEFLALLDTPAAPFLLDVRETEEFAEWSIPGAVNIPLGQLESRLSEVPQSQAILVICAKGARALAGATLLVDRGYDATVMDGGMGSWGTTYDTVTVELGGAMVTQVRRRGKGCLSYVIAAGGVAAVIDPSVDIDQYVTSTLYWRHIVLGERGTSGPGRSSRTVCSGAVSNTS